MSRADRILILGANGQVGKELRRSFADVGEVIACDRTMADLSQPESLRDVIREVAPSILLNAAAYTAVDRAESETETAMTINGVAPGVLAEEAAKLDALLVHYSTDYVFDGSKQQPWIESDAPNPLNVYGKTKLAGERAIQRVGGKYLIFRTSWVYGPHGQNFLLTMLRLGKERDQLRIVNDQHGAPTSAIAIADATRASVSQALLNPQSAEWSGVYHFTCSGQTTWFDFARAIFQGVAAPPEKPWPQLTGIPSAEYPVPAKRPAYSVLANEKLYDAFHIRLPHWNEALDEVVRTLDSK